MSKTTLGIYGDSYALDTNFFNEVSNEYEVYDHTVPGAAVSYLVDIVDKTNSYDNAIFVVAGFTNISFNLFDKWYHIQNSNVIPSLIKTENSAVVDVLNSLLIHYTHTFEEELYEAGVREILDKLKSRNKNLIVKYIEPNTKLKAIDIKNN